MKKWKITRGPDRLQFAMSLFDDIRDPKMLPRPQARGDNQEPDQFAVEFAVKDEEGQARLLQLSICVAAKHSGFIGSVMEFEGVVYAAHNQYSDLIFGDPTTLYAFFRGEYDFHNGDGHLEQYLPN